MAAPPWWEYALGALDGISLTSLTPEKILMRKTLWARRLVGGSTLLYTPEGYTGADSPPWLEVIGPNGMHITEGKNARWEFTGGWWYASDHKGNPLPPQPGEKVVR